MTFESHRRSWKSSDKTAVQHQTLTQGSRRTQLPQEPRCPPLSSGARVTSSATRWWHRCTPARTLGWDNMSDPCASQTEEVLDSPWGRGCRPGCRRCPASSGTGRARGRRKPAEKDQYVSRAWWPPRGLESGHLRKEQVSSRLLTHTAGVRDNIWMKI